VKLVNGPFLHKTKRFIAGGMQDFLVGTTKRFGARLPENNSVLEIFSFQKLVPPGFIFGESVFAPEFILKPGETISSNRL